LFPEVKTVVASSCTTSGSYTNLNSSIGGIRRTRRSKDNQTLGTRRKRRGSKVTIV